jgi:hypothetical protein
LCGTEEYVEAVNMHLQGPSYRRIARLDPCKIEFKINEVWKTICKNRNIPKHINDHYSMCSSKIPLFKGLIKTHKTGNLLKIRPIVNCINGPSYKMSWFLQKLLQKYALTTTYSITRSDVLIGNLRFLSSNQLEEYSYPMSLDVVDMFTSIPSYDSVNLLFDLLVRDNFEYFGLMPSDIRKLLLVVLENNYFQFANKSYKQISGLPMGNKLSGLLAEIFMDQLERQIISTNNIRFYYRYVDDTLILARNRENAGEILEMFNSASDRLRFEIEHPNEGRLNLLDFSLKIVDGNISIKPYTKPARSSVFLNGNSALPQRVINNTIVNEWRRIRARCDNKKQMKEEKYKLINRLTNNGHRIIPKLHFSERSKPVTEDKSHRFFLTVPFISEEVNSNIRKVLHPLGLRIAISHQGKPLKNFFNLKINTQRRTCCIKDCPIKSSICFQAMVVYKVECKRCSQFYIGSTKKHLHLRIKEHYSLKSSSISQHGRKCGNEWKYTILSKCKSIPEVRFKEAILIKELNPMLNVKEEIFTISSISLL